MTPLGLNTFLHITFDWIEKEAWGWVPKCFSRLDASNHVQHGPLLELKSKSKVNLAALTSGHPRSRSHIDLSRSCRISSDAYGREQHFDTCLMSPSHSNQKLSKETYQT